MLPLIKQILKYRPTIIVLILIFTIICCNKNEDKVHLASVSTMDVLDLTQSSAILRGNLSNSGATGPTNLQYGFCLNTNGSPTINNNRINVGSLPGEFSYNVINLTPNTTYYYRTFASNDAGLVYGNEKIFTTFAFPSLKTDTSTNITDSSATISGSIINDAGNEIISAGICWKADTTYYYNSPRTLDLNDSILIAPKGETTFSFNLKGLGAYVKYDYCTYVTTNKGTFYAKRNYFRTTVDLSNVSIVKDIDGHVYNTITIKNKVWMTQELKTKHYANNDSIPFVNDVLTWIDIKQGVYRSWNGWVDIWNDLAKLYNYYAIIDSRNVCPVGWHVSTDKDWSGLIDYFGGNKLAPRAMSDVMRFYNDNDYYWTLSEDKTTAGSLIYLRNSYKISLEKTPKYIAMSVVCVKD